MYESDFTNTKFLKKYFSLKIKSNLVKGLVNLYTMLSVNPNIFFRPNSSYL